MAHRPQGPERPKPIWHLQFREYSVESMHIGMIGLGRMGSGLTRRLLAAGHCVDVFDRDEKAGTALAALGATRRANIAALVAELPVPKRIWVMLPAGEPTQATICELAGLLPADSTVIDGGNSDFRGTIALATELQASRVDLVDIGVSGGVWGAQNGFCLMIGGAPRAVHPLQPIFHALSGSADAVAMPSWGETAACGYHHCGGAGAGHFVKMVHNAIEYGMMQAIAEGFDMLSTAAFTFGDLSLPEIAETWRHGSVVRSWLIDLAAQALAGDPKLEDYAQSVSDSGEGRWAVETSIALALPTPVITAALFARFRSRQDGPLGERLLQALRHQFGGHTQ
jgi:6-phosphogluconate dehydrogenase